MEKQQNFTDIEYINRRRTTKREAFLEKSILNFNIYLFVDLFRYIPYFTEIPELFLLNYFLDIFGFFHVLAVKSSKLYQSQSLHFCFCRLKSNMSAVI